MKAFRRPVSLVWIVALALVGCGGAVSVGPDDTRFEYGAQSVLVRESGAIIVGKRQVGVARDDGKIVDTRGQLLAWVHDGSIRLRGGASLDIRQDAEGALYLGTAEQQAAGLRPLEHRLRRDGTLARGNNRGIQIEGLGSERRRRAVLAILLLTENQLWESASPAGGRDGSPDDEAPADDEDDGADDDEMSF